MSRNESNRQFRIGPVNERLAIIVDEPVAGVEASPSGSKATLQGRILHCGPLVEYLVSGQRVAFLADGSHEVTCGGEVCTIVHQDDILAVID